MKAKLNKILSVVITLCMVAGMLPGMSLTAFATTSPQVSYEMGEAYKYTSNGGSAALSYGTSSSIDSSAESSITGNTVTLCTTTGTDNIDKNYKLIYVPVKVTVAVPANTEEYYVRHNIKVDANRVVADANAAATASAAVYYLGESDASSELTFYPYYSNATEKDATDDKERGMACQGEAGNLQQSFSDSFEQTICYENSTNSVLEVTRYFGVMLVITNASTYENTATADFTFTAEEAHGHDGIVFTEWTATDSLPTTEGNYCLANDVTLSSRWEIPTGETSICLNGHTITQEQDNAVLSVYDGETLSIYDCGTGGKITHAEGVKGRGVYIETGGTFNLYSGAISGNKSDSYGGGVYMFGGTCNMFGGSITGNKAEKYGGGVCHGSGTITVSGEVVIKDNYKSDGTTPSNLYFASGKTLTVGALTAGAEIGVNTFNAPTATAPVVFTNTIDESNRDTYKAYFTSDNSAYTIGYNASGRMQLTAPVTHDHADGTVFDKKWTATGGTISTSGNYYLADDIIATSNIIIDSGADVTLCLNGKTLDMGSYYITNNGTLTICDCQDGGSITSSNSVISNYGTLAVSDSEIAGNAYGIYNNKSGTVEISGGEVIGGDRGISNNGTLDVSGGEITGDYGILNSGELTVAGGKVIGNLRGISNDTSGIVGISGGTVISSYCGIYNYRGTLAVSGGNVEATTLSLSSYGIFNTDGTATVSGGTVSSAYYGIYNASSGTIEVTGGKVTGTYYGIYNASSGTVYLSGSPTISRRYNEDLYSNSGRIYAKSADATSAYTGDDLTVYVVTANIGEAVIYSVTSSNKDKFTLTNDGYFLTLGTDDNANNLVIAKTHTHSWSSAWSSDTTAHWHECTADGCDITEKSQKDGYAEHTPNADDGDCTTPIKCSECQAETTVAKSHAYTYSASGAVITEKCSNPDCTAHTETATISAPTGTLTYNGTTEFKASVTYSDEWAGGKDLVISYTRDGDITSAGEITASITKSGQTASVNYTVAKADVVITVDTTPIVKTYGEVWSLPTATTNFGTVACDKEITDLTNAGSYTVTYSVAGTDNYNGDIKYVSVTVNPQTVAAPAADTTVFVYTGSEKTYALASDARYEITNNTRTNAGSQNVRVALLDKDNYTWADGSTDDLTYEFVIAKANAVITVDTTPIVKTYGEVWSLPTATTNFGTVACDKEITDLTNAGSYTVTYSVAGTDNYNGDTKTVDVTIEKAIPTIDTIPTASRVRRGNALSTSTFTGGVVKGVDGAEITGTFAWKDASEVMDTNGTLQKTVVFTPDSTNYLTFEFDVDVEVYTSSGGGGTTRYTVKFDTDGGSTVKSETVNRNGKVTEPTEPKKDGYVFDGWHTDKDLTEEYDFESKVTKSFTLYAKWTETEKEPDEDDNTDTLKWNPFIDVAENDWFHDVIKEAYLTGLVTGTTDATFTPDGNITRGMFVTILWRAEGEPAAPKLNFTDVANDWYYCDAIAWANANGIVKGVSKTKFAPDNNITREQMAAILFRYATYKGMDTVHLAENLGQFTDSSNITEYAASALNWAVGAGIISGKGNGILDPLGNATRAEATAVLVRFLDIIK